ncbi:MAG TPA: VWA domain-containing protein [Vicinamibacterales bacterium]|nr:VWA domain-containing protein [Vicinamibacterales bacterium]
MRRAASTIAALVLAGAAAIGAQQPVYRSEAAGVPVTVSVRSAGKAVTGLTAQDFTITDNGIAQKVSSVSVESLPIDVTLLLDVSGSVSGARLERLKSSVIETAKLLRPVDRVRLIAMQYELRQVFGYQAGGTRPPIEQLTAFGGTSLYDGLAAAMMRAGEPGRRQLIVASTDGDDTISILPEASVKEIAEYADAVVHVIIPVVGGRNAKPSSTPAMTTLNDVTVRTGGQVFSIDPGAPINDAFAQALEEFRTSYVLRYQPEGTLTPGWHEVTVAVKGGPYDIRARKGYSVRK